MIEDTEKEVLINITPLQECAFIHLTRDLFDKKELEDDFSENA